MFKITHAFMSPRHYSLLFLTALFTILRGPANLYQGEGGEEGHVAEKCSVQRHSIRTYPTHA